MFCDGQSKIEKKIGMAHQIFKTILMILRQLATQLIDM